MDAILTTLNMLTMIEEQLSKIPDFPLKSKKKTIQNRNLLLDSMYLLKEVKEELEDINKPKSKQKFKKRKNRELNLRMDLISLVTNLNEFAKTVKENMPAKPEETDTSDVQPTIKVHKRTFKRKDLTDNSEPKIIHKIKVHKHTFKRKDITDNSEPKIIHKITVHKRSFKRKLDLTDNSEPPDEYPGKKFKRMS